MIRRWLYLPKWFQQTLAQLTYWRSGPQLAENWPLSEPDLPNLLPQKYGCPATISAGCSIYASLVRQGFDHWPTMTSKQVWLVHLSGLKQWRTRGSSGYVLFEQHKAAIGYFQVALPQSKAHVAFDCSRSQNCCLSWLSLGICHLSDFSFGGLPVSRARRGVFKEASGATRKNWTHTLLILLVLYAIGLRGVSFVSLEGLSGLRCCRVSSLPESQCTRQMSLAKNKKQTSG